MLTSTKILTPECLQLDVGGQTAYGCDQEWYHSKWRRMGGCGPVAAAMQFIYLAAKHNLSIPYGMKTKEKALASMNEAWRFVTPSLGGLHTIQMFETGAMKIAARHKLNAECRLLPVAKENRCDARAMLDYLKKAIESDMPVAFLNLHNGGIEQLDTWHWVTITALNGSEAEFYDQGKVLSLDIAAWHANSKLGGGFAYIELADSSRRI